MNKQAKNNTHTHKTFPDNLNVTVKAVSPGGRLYVRNSGYARSLRSRLKAPHMQDQ